MTIIKDIKDILFDPKKRTYQMCKLVESEVICSSVLVSLDAVDLLANPGQHNQDNQDIQDKQDNQSVSPTKPQIEDNGTEN